MAELDAALFEFAPSAMLYFDADLCLQRINRQAQLWWQLSPAAGLNQPLSSLALTGIDEQRLREAISGLAGNGLATLENGERYLDIIYTPIPEQAGGHSVLVSATDVSEQYALERELKRRGDELQAVLDNLGEGVLLADTHGNQLYLNEAGRTMLGMVAGTELPNLESYKRPSVHDLSGNEMPINEYPISRALRGERFTDAELYFSGQDGIARRLSSSGSSLKDEEGRVRLGISVFHDVSKLHDLEMRLKESRDELLAVLDNMTDTVSLVEANGQIRYINPAARKLVALAPDQPLGSLSPADTATPNDSGNGFAAARELTHRALSGEIFTDAEITMRAADTTQHIFSVSGSSVRDDAGRVRLGITVGRDMTAQRNLEQELKNKNDELQAVLDYMPDSVVLFESDGRIRYRNRASQNFLGQRLSEDVNQIEDYGQRIDVRDGDGQPLSVADYPISHVLESAEAAEGEMTITFPDGTWKSLRQAAARVRDQAGNLRLVVSIVQDITNQVRLTNSLRESRDELQAVLDNMTEGVLLFEANGQVRYRNAAQLRLMGMTSASALAVPGQILNIRRADGSPVVPGEFPLERILKGEVFSTVEYLFTSLGGEQIVVACSGSSVLRSDGSIGLGIFVMHDISKLREAEQQVVTLLQEAEQERNRLDSVIEQMPEGVIIIAAPNDRLVRMNRVASEIYGLDADLLPRINPTNLTHYETFSPEGEALPPAARPLQRAMSGEVVKAAQLRVRRADQKEVDLLVSAAPIIEGSGENERISGAVSVFQDISELKELDRIKDEFISITSHELRTPLTSIKGYAEVMSRRLQRMDDNVRTTLQKPLNTIIERTERMTQLVNDLLDVSNIATGRLEVVGSSLDLSSIITKLVAEARLTSQRTFHLALSNGPVIVLGEERLIEQVLTNLIGNAVKYSPAEGIITIRLTKETRHAEVSVTDQGIGIGNEQQTHLFERFYRTKQAKDHASGLGLGLYIASSIVTAHGGRLWVESEGAGKGSTFIFTVPLAEQQS